ncbi:outer membrane lipoprotein-sorting protein [Methylomarinovum tepidoasis]|nr:outer membrane lipoprotein-sorting protein [Methylomarinovum sp. IN45]
MPIATVCLLCLLLLVWSAPAPAQTPEERGLEIAREADRRDQGWQTFSADLTMVLRNREGETSQRRIKAYNLEVPGDGDRSLLVFRSPADVSGTRFLTFSHKRGDDDQWLYLPALKRVKRISAANKGGSFMGSEFSYEDMSAPELEKFSYRYLRDDDYKGRKVFVIERVPVDAHSLYSRQVVWIDKEFYIPWKIAYYNRRGDHLKTLTYHKYKRYLGKYWRPGRMVMVNHRNGKATALVRKNYRFRDPQVQPGLFSPQGLGGG